MINSYNTMLDILNRVNELKDLNKPLSKKWKFKPKVFIYINPEAICPYCRKTFSTNRIWLVDDNKDRLKGCWDLDGTNLYDSNQGYSSIHPHVNSRGSICLGDNSKASDTLFTGLKAGIHYESTGLSIQRMGHSCYELEDRLIIKKCERCDEDIDESNICSNNCSR